MKHSCFLRIAILLFSVLPGLAYANSAFLAAKRASYIKDSIGDLVAKKQTKQRGALYEAYLSNGELDGVLVCKCFFPKMNPLQINEGLRDIRRFIQDYVAMAVKNFPNKVGEQFLTNILHVYGHVINFIDHAWIDRKTKGICVIEDQDWIPNADPLRDYWWYLERMEGVTLHCYKFYASCLDYLTIMTRAYLLFPCYDYKQWGEMDTRWFWWLEKVTSKLSDNAVFGGYYQENVKLFSEVYALWKNDFEEKQKKSPISRP